jgi:hypothetical protein
MTQLTIKGKFDKNYVESAMLEVYLKWGIPKNVEHILVIDNPLYFKYIEKFIPKTARKEFVAAYKNDPTSMSLTYGTFDLIVISISLKEEKYLKTNKKALVGLLAHELMHITQRRKGLDRAIRADAIRAFTKFEPKLRKLKIAQPVVADFYASIGESANFTLKDIYDNFELIDDGMGEYILEDYWNLYMAGKRFSKPKFYSVKDSDYKLIEHIKQAIDFELNLISAISPFVKMARAGNKKATKLVNFIAKNYEVNIGEVANAYDDVIQYSINNFKWSGQYRRKFFTIVFKRAFYLLDSLELKYRGIEVDPSKKHKPKSKRKRCVEIKNK